MVTRQEIAASLRNMGLQAGDIVLLHSSLASTGGVEGGAPAVIDAFLDVLGAEGTLLVPVFGALGILTEELKYRPGAVTSDAPVGTLAALGKRAAELCRDHWKAATAHGEGTPFTRIAAAGGYVCLLGCDQDRNTSLHGVEALLQLPYLRDAQRTFTAPSGETVTKTWKYYPGPHRDFIGLDHLLAPATVRGKIGNAEVRLIDAKKMFELALAAGKVDPAFALCDNPACPDCVAQRAAIYADAMRRESFQLAVSSRLAGRYVPEMIENLQISGIGAVELDYVQGVPWFARSAEALTADVAALKAAKIAVSGARLTAIPAASADWVNKAKTAGITRVILPLFGSEKAAQEAAAAGLQVELANAGAAGEATAAALAAFPVRCPLVFNPVNFVLAGEKPFLGSYRLARAIKSAGQLDVADALWTGEPRTFARGNAEIKELVSIFRCRNFRGWMVLGGGAVYPGTLREAAADWQKLLQEI